MLSVVVNFGFDVTFLNVHTVDFCLAYDKMDLKKSYRFIFKWVYDINGLKYHNMSLYGLL